jgi:uncharacterized protein (DUF433 family)
MPDGGNYVGVGIFTVPDAARLSGVAASRLRRWVFGRGGTAVIQPQLATEGGREALGFYNLIEVLFIQDLARQQVGFGAIRKLIARARNELKDAHPFATKRLHVSGRELFLEIATETGDRHLLNLTSGNFAMLEVLEHSFQRSITFGGPDGHASEWRPFPGLDRIIIDPTRKFGRPIDRQTGMPTEVLAASLIAESGDVDRVARLWEVPAEAVRQAAEFEVNLGYRHAA